MGERVQVFSLALETGDFLVFLEDGGFLALDLLVQAKYLELDHVVVLRVLIDGGSSLLDQFVGLIRLRLAELHFLLERVDLPLEAGDGGLHLDFLLLQVIILVLVILCVLLDSVVVVLRHLIRIELLLPLLDLQDPLLILFLHLSVFLRQPLYILFLLLKFRFQQFYLGFERGLRK